MQPIAIMLPETPAKIDFIAKTIPPLRFWLTSPSLFRVVPAKIYIY